MWDELDGMSGYGQGAVDTQRLVLGVDPLVGVWVGS